MPSCHSFRWQLQWALQLLPVPHHYFSRVTANVIKRHKPLWHQVLLRSVGSQVHVKSQHHNATTQGQTDVVELLHFHLRTRRGGALACHCTPAVSHGALDLLPAFHVCFAPALQGLPNAATTSCFSGVVREPLAGIDVTAPISPDLPHAIISHRCCVQAILDLHDVPSATMAQVSMRPPVKKD